MLVHAYAPPSAAAAAAAAATRSADSHVTALNAVQACDRTSQLAYVRLTGSPNWRVGLLPATECPARSVSGARFYIAVTRYYQHHTTATSANY